MNYKEKLDLYNRAKRIIASDLEWEDKYDMIFSNEISKKFSLDYWDPDSSYEDDVMAFMSALHKYMEKERIIHEQIDI